MFDTHMYCRKETIRVGKSKSFSLHFVFKSQNPSVPVCSYVRTCRSIIQKHKHRCPTVFEEMKCNLMLNMEGIFHSLTLKVVGDVTPPLQGIQSVCEEGPPAQILPKQRCFLGIFVWVLTK